jgi:hypothetical protein
MTIRWTTEAQAALSRLVNTLPKTTRLRPRRQWVPFSKELNSFWFSQIVAAW